MSTNDFSGKAAIVTGGASGIGLAIVRALAQAGGAVVVADVGGLADGLEELRGAGAHVLYEEANVTDAADWGRVVERCAAELGSIDILFNNAGVTSMALIHEMDDADWHRVIDVDLTGVYLGCKAVLPRMVERGSGAIVNTASTLGFMANHMLGAYTAAKHGVIGLTKQVALDYGRFGVRCNCICPGPTWTPNIERSYGTQEALRGRGKYLLDSIALGRMADPAEIAAAALFLASDAASFVTGASLVVDGGSSVHTGPTWREPLFHDANADV
jgi:NAD(P)-dependent dehydrogenase (short-subunit alcohol dehydrogenase family)